MLTPQEQATLEALIDQHTLGDVLDALGGICYEKADHVRSNWQDEALADTWERVAERLDKVNAENL